MDPNEGQESLIAQQFGPDPYQDHENKMDLIFTGQFHLSDVYITSEHEVYGAFCDFDPHTTTTTGSIAPRYIDLYGSSRHCQEHFVTFPLFDVANACRTYDNSTTTTSTTTDPTAFIFHQPKSGSTLLTNMIVAASSSSSNARVITDPGALTEILTCQECDEELKVRAVQDVVYLLGRQNTHKQQQWYIQLASSNTIGISIMTRAFDHTKWIYLYRKDAHVVLQKLMNHRVYRRKHCSTKKRRNPGRAMVDFLESQSKSVTGLETDEQVCAAELATHRAAVTQELNDNTPMGRLVEYHELTTHEGIARVLDFLEVSDPDWERVDEQRHKRASRSSSSANKEEVWEGEQELLVSHEVKSAAAEFSLL